MEISKNIDIYEENAIAWMRLVFIKSLLNSEIDDRYKIQHIKEQIDVFEKRVRIL